MDAWSVSARELAPPPARSTIEWEWRVIVWGSFAAMMPSAIVVGPAALLFYGVHYVGLGWWIRADARVRRLALPACREQLLEPWGVLVWYLPWSRGWRGLALLVGYGAWLFAALLAVGVWLVLVELRSS